MRKRKDVTLKADIYTKYAEYICKELTNMLEMQLHLPTLQQKAEMRGKMKKLHLEISTHRHSPTYMLFHFCVRP